MSEKPVVILTYPSIQYEDNYPCSWIPYSILSIASALKTTRPNVEVVLFDENKKSIDNYKDLLNEKENILCVGYSIMTGGGQIAHALELAEITKKIKPQIINVFGGAVCKNFCKRANCDAQMISGA